MYFGIATFPQKKIQDIANSYRKRYDPHYSLIPPHITLKDKFQLEDDQVEAIVTHLEKIADTTPAFQTTISKVSHFHPTSHTLYFSIDNDAPFKSLHHQIQQPFEPQDQPYDFIPHLTIGQRMKEEELHDVYGTLRLKKFYLSTKIDRFQLMYQLENGSWTIYQTFLLKG